MKLFNFRKKKQHGLPMRFWTVHELSDAQRSEQMLKRLNENLKGAEFKKLITKYLTPQLRELGFKGGGYNFHKRAGNYIHTIQVFGSRHGGEGWIEVGIHADFLPDSTNEPIDPEKVKTIDCFLRHSLHLSNGNQMVDYGTNEEEAKFSLSLMHQMIAEQGMPYFKLFENFPEPFDTITLEALKSNAPLMAQYKMPLNDMGMLLHAARIKHRLGLREGAVEIAEYGKTLVDGFVGSGGIVFFDKIIRGEDSFYLTPEEKEASLKEEEELHKKIFGE